MLRRLANRLYDRAFPLYRPLYAAFKAYSDRTERRLLSRHIEPGATVVDAGANIGIYVAFFARLGGPQGRVHAFEPAPANFRRLKSLTARLANVQCNEAALGARSGESILYVSHELNVDHRSYPVAGESRRPVTVRTIALDDYFQPGERVDFIKMDIQGYELHALRGACRVVSENRNIKLLLEFWPHGLTGAGVEPAELLRDLVKHGFSASVVTKQGLRPAPAELADNREPNYYCNLFASRL